MLTRRARLGWVYCSPPRDLTKLGKRRQAVPSCRCAASSCRFFSRWLARDWKTGAPHSLLYTSFLLCAKLSARFGESDSATILRAEASTEQEGLDSSCSEAAGRFFRGNQRLQKGAGGVKLEHQAWSWVAIRRETSSFNNEWKFFRYTWPTESRLPLVYFYD